MTQYTDPEAPKISLTPQTPEFVKSILLDSTVANLQRQVDQQTSARQNAEDRIFELEAQLEAVETAFIKKAVDDAGRNWLSAAKLIEDIAWDKLDTDPTSSTQLFSAAAEILLKIDRDHMDSKAAAILTRRIAELLEYSDQMNRAQTVISKVLDHDSPASDFYVYGQLRAQERLLEKNWIAREPKRKRS